MLDSLGPEGGEQGLIDRTQAPGSEHGYQQLDSTRHQACNPIASANALRLEHIGQARGGLLQLLETVLRAVALAVFTVERYAVVADMPVTALDTGIECFQAALQYSCSGLLIVETLRCAAVITHRQTPRFLLLE
ncbi:hypothetical protein D3C80_929520 [compost metagenome]